MMETGTELIVRLRDMAPDDLARVHQLSRQVQWPHRIEDWGILLRIGQGLVAEQDEAIVGTVMGWTYGIDAACLGMVIVDPARQGQGIGRKLMDAMLDRLDNRAIMLNATAEGLPLYKKLGFEPVGTIHQHQGAAFSLPIASLGADERVRPMGRRDHAVIAELDRKATGLERGPLIAEMLRDRARGVMLARDGEAIGFALFRRFGLGHSIGPVVAPNIEGAKALITHWLGSKAGMFTRLDVPGDSGLREWLEGLGLAGVGEVTTMVRGMVPARDAGAKTFAITSQALG